MTDETKPFFYDAKVGDKVYCIRNGEGTITRCADKFSVPYGIIAAVKKKQGEPR